MTSTERQSSSYTAERLVAHAEAGAAHAQKVGEAYGQLAKTTVLTTGKRIAENIVGAALQQISLESLIREAGEGLQ